MQENMWAHCRQVSSSLLPDNTAIFSPAVTWLGQEGFHGGAGELQSSVWVENRESCRDQRLTAEPEERDLCQNKGFIVMKYPGRSGTLYRTPPLPPKCNATPKPSRHCKLITEHCLHNYIHLHQCLIGRQNQKEMKLKEKSKGKKHTEYTLCG